MPRYDTRVAVSFRFPFVFDVARLRADVDAAVSAGWIAHFNTDSYAGDWSGIPLRANNPVVPMFADPSNDEWHDTDAMRACTYVPVVLRAFECPLESVRFLKLAAGAEIKEHHDPGASLEQGLARIHIPIRTSDAVEFFLGGQRMHWAEGEAWYGNFALPHRVVNRGTADRIHLVIDARTNEWLRATLV